MDWSECSDVERRADVLSGAWTVRGTRVPPEAIIENADDGFSAEWIASEIFPTVPVEKVRHVIAFARAHETHPA